MGRWIALLALAGMACLPQGEVLEVTAGAYVSEETPTAGACGEELRSGAKSVAVSNDLHAHGLVCGSSVRIEGFPGTYRVLDRSADDVTAHIDIFMGRDAESARKWGVRSVKIYWEPPDLPD